MPFLLIVLFANVFLPREMLIDDRYRVAGVHLLDGAIFLALIGAVIFGGRANVNSPVELQRHPLIIWLLLLLGIGFAMGISGGLVNAAPLWYTLGSAREYVMLPICIFIGYRCLSSFDTARRYVHLYVIGGLIVGFFLLRHWLANAELYAISDNIAFIRSINYVSSYAMVGALLLLYVLAAGIRFWPKPVMILAASFMVVAVFAMMHRAEWIMMASIPFAMLLLLPRNRRLGVTVKGLTFAALLASVIYGSLFVASNLTQRNWHHTVHKRIMSFLPGSNQGINEEKAWDSRLSAIPLELGIWLRSPLTGGGFAAQESETVRHGVFNHGQNHNGWASVLAKSGVFGFMGSMLVVATLLVLGRRMVNESTDDTTRLFGSLCYIAGCALAISVLTSMVWTTRTAAMIGILTGMLVKLREMQLALAAAEQTEWLPIENDPYLQTEPDYQPQLMLRRFQY